MSSPRRLLFTSAVLVVAAAVILVVLVLVNRPRNATCTIHPDPTDQCVDHTYVPQG